MLNFKDCTLAKLKFDIFRMLKVLKTIVAELIDQRSQAYETQSPA